MKIKNIAYLVFAVLLSVTLASCHKEKSRYQQIEEFREGLTAEDTTQMLKLSDDCMELLKAKKINDALSMLYEYNDSLKSVEPLGAGTKQQYERRFKMFPVLEYQRDYFSFQLQGLNDVKYKVKFAIEEHPEVNGEAITAFMFNPVKIDGTWYLTVKKGDQEFDRTKN